MSENESLLQIEYSLANEFTALDLSIPKMCVMWIICSYANSIIVKKHDNFSVIIETLGIICGYYAYHKVDTQNAFKLGFIIAFLSLVFFMINES